MNHISRRLALLTCLILACCVDGMPALRADPRLVSFTNPRRVMIAGYDGDAMEPSLSRDGRYLFFNNANDPAVDTNLHWAMRIGDLSFEYRGEIAGVNSAALDAVASMDRGNVFYFVSTRSYNETASTLYRGIFADGKVAGVELVPGVSAAVPGIVNFDAEISPDGGTLYFVESRFGPDGPETADILIAERAGAGFVRLGKSVMIMCRINTSALEYAPAVSDSGRELYFTRLVGDLPAVFAAIRPDTVSPFGTPHRIAAITGFAEAPSLSLDGKALYYHKKEQGRFVIYRVARR